MQINPSQPIMFDTETMPGQGTGWWQVNRFMDDSRPAGRPVKGDRIVTLARIGVMLLILAIFIYGAIDTFSR